MTLFQLILVFDKSVIRKQSLLLITLLFCLFNLKAQVKNNVKLGVETGFLLFSDSENLGLMLNIEPKLKVSENNFMGVRFGVAINSHSIKIKDSLKFRINENNDHGAISFMPTFDYYLNDNNRFRPYLGVGLGFYLLSVVDVIPTVGNPAGEAIEVNFNNQIGALFRGGFESVRLRIGLEYNFVPTVDIELPDGKAVGTVNSSYFGISIGFIIGGEKI